MQPDPRTTGGHTGGGDEGGPKCATPRHSQLGASSAMYLPNCSRRYDHKIGMYLMKGDKHGVYRRKAPRHSPRSSAARPERATLPVLIPRLYSAIYCVNQVLFDSEEIEGADVVDSTPYIEYREVNSPRYSPRCMTQLYIESREVNTPNGWF